MRRCSADHASAIVVGAGVFGASAASALSARGWRVTLIERYAPANSRSSSGDWSRLLRFGHAGDAATQEWYTRSAWRARTLWQALGEEDDRELLADTGAVWFVSGDGAGEDAAGRTMRLVGPSCERLSRSQLKSLFPAIHVDDLAYGLFELEAGVLRASDCVRALVRQAVHQGTRLRHGTAVPRGETVVLDEEILEADRVIWARGAWLGKLFPRWAPIIATRQMVFYWDADPAWRNGPAWIDARAERYGMPDVDGLGLKAQTSQAGPAVDPDSAREADHEAEQQTKAYLARRFPAVAQVPLLRAHTMYYEMTLDGNFLIGPLPALEKVWIIRVVLDMDSNTAPRSALTSPT